MASKLALPANKNLEQVVRRATEVSTIPAIALKVAEVAADEEATVANLKTVLESDAPLSARVLRHVNSSAIGLRNRITNLGAAIAYLGMRQIRNMAIAASVCDLFKSQEKIGNYTRPNLWKHLVAVAICSQKLAMRQRMPNFEDAFLAGLLHDFGIILEDQYAHADFCKVLLNPELSSSSLQDAERQQMGFDHTILGQRVAANWKLPEVVKAAVAFHHCSNLYRGPESAVLACVEVANMICSFHGWTSIGVNLVVPRRELIDQLGLSAADVTVLAEGTEKELEQRKDWLGS